ncbi:cystathionine beta-lyase [Beijerinckia indica]|uniref:Cystathionine beta-lyase n=1 Tax=Beijerinckia indica subsp. indica (strain ATCC 9039 / DSM 1715 / NCIMB 8712) TaxID=395963 RepID=B2IBX8_BEII9|nr:cystathionine beta-lyase [Beijerinckia indica]ACB95236.1 cystathionine beta-lyase [Beijerinckia indica subsp. indica ATCC 9039]
MTDTKRDGHKGFKSRTRLVHAGRDPSEQFGYVNTPIYRGSTVLYPTLDDLYARRGRFSYGTQGTPTTQALETAWTELAGAAGTVLVPTGLAAITLALLTAVKAGDHILVTDSAYRPCRNFCDTVLRRMGVETTYYDPLIGGGLESLVRQNTRVVFLETPGSQSFELQDVVAIKAVAEAHDLCTIIDNTWGTPLFFPPHERGMDMAIEAGTKYLSGHSDLLLGLVSANARWYPRLRATYDAFAMCPGPEDVFLALRGLRTMELRLREAERQGLAMARWLAARPEVVQVLHPALPQCPGHALWKRDFLGSTGLFSVLLAPFSREALAAMLDGLELFGMGYSWGGFESLVIPFDCRTYRTATQWNPPGPALRFSIGLEDIEDLQADLAAGFERLNAHA